jgi:hypothetical protein
LTRTPEQNIDAARPLDSRDGWYSDRMFRTVTHHIGLVRVMSLDSFPFRSHLDVLFLEGVSLPDTRDKDGLIRI